jgi:CubicO group peptidase (beta-lactamase class C family)
MKRFSRIFLLILFIFAGIIYWQFPRLNIISGFSAKNMCSCMFEADREQEFVMETDNNFSPINIAKYEVDTLNKRVTASVLGFMKRTAIYQDDLGCKLVLKNEKSIPVVYNPVPHNYPSEAPFPFGNEKQKDTVFSNIDYQKLLNAVTNVFDKNEIDSLKTRSLLVVYKNMIIAEKYDEGFDENSKILGWSMSKSVLASLLGILERKGEFDVNATHLFKEWSNDERANITLNALLQMNSGLEWEEDYNKISDVTKMLFLESDMSQIQLNKPLQFKLNKHWNYSSGTTNLLSKYLRDQFDSHEAYLDFPVKQLYDKLGMSSMIVETDLSGNYIFSSYGWATTRDWAKLGLLYLHKGNWNGEQLLNESWVKYVSTPCEGSNDTYGAHFWLNRGSELPDIPMNMYYMDGYQGQRVFIIPSHDLVVVRMGLTNIDFNKMLKEIIESIQ